MNNQGINDQDIVTRFERGSKASAREADGALEPGCSVAICTYKRAASLSRFLDSLREQQPYPQQLVIVDASPDEETEAMVRQHPVADELADGLLYFRVSDALKGLTRQRNFALRWVSRDLVAFFDDDIVLLPHCLEEMEKPHRSGGDKIAGVGAFIPNELKRPPFMWRLRRLLRVVPTLQPGKYCRSGFAISWTFMRPTEKWIEGNWLRGCAMMWKTAPAREIGFNEDFSGYSSGEDVDFSLRMGRRGRLVVAGKARVLHLHASSGRPNAYMMGYTGIYNSYSIHKRCLPNRTWKDVAWFIYAYWMDALMRIANLPAPGDTMSRLQFLKGRLRFCSEVLRSRKFAP